MGGSEKADHGEGHPLRGRRHRGQRIEPDARMEQRRAAVRLRECWQEDRRDQIGISVDYTRGLAAYIQCYGEHWARVLGASPLAFALGGVGPGWDELLIELDARLAAIDPGYCAERISEKYGQLRVDVISLNGSELTEQLEQVAEEFESRSAAVCEKCGQPGTLRQDQGWWTTRCDRHA